MSVTQRLNRLERIMSKVAFNVPIGKRRMPLDTAYNKKATQIQELTCIAFGVTLEQVTSRGRPERVCRARKAIAYLIREDAGPVTFEDIAPFVGKFEHSAASHSYNRGKDMMEPGIDAAFAATVNEIRQKISTIPS